MLLSSYSIHPKYFVKVVSYAFDTLYSISEDDVWMRVHSKVMTCAAEGDHL
jgi:hypothetical protein